MILIRMELRKLVMEKLREKTAPPNVLTGSGVQLLFAFELLEVFQRIPFVAYGGNTQFLLAKQVGVDHRIRAQNLFLEIHGVFCLLQ
ncbi:hypothetical protein L6164_003423 [Bauhinia variegata]|uniref:Uncharacterized protein n=1 Tax=Bauhinia variegata TaxID=167791 RepID=A0ACB9Q1F2_BAUVA|nr:hypothetical protein L6164_003423 [Bauhinia variegata]